ncbi:Uncharacterised protein [Mycobacteroides abscessus subsp. massiliense]|nr:Uncharacterised protein [Mycobacteroides abscessus subsp. massiliense]SKG99444.1 Uncharacterised protein [Mycobacteroides abscessus subsp. massiliense]SKI01148.1 Uncharacterised protein [Mycobacteroides abscessus subsp. massiliense]SKJ04970.1 Uncharacterised protein [Mycobacteroides abscessus subsp. massiliense]SKJ09525.1 Uncharacterised protein [Mycobacteroides abscessus subsp. massiliense]
MAQAAVRVITCYRRPLSGPVQQQPHTTRRSRIAVAFTLAAVAGLVITLLHTAFRAGADPSGPGVPTPKPIPNQVAQPDSLNRDAFIGGARTSTNSGLGMGTGTGPPLAAARERTNATISPSATDGTVLPTAIGNKTVTLHLPNERELTAAQWGDGGNATFTSRDTDYRIIPFAGGGVDVNIIRRSVFTPETFTFGMRLPEGTHAREGANVVLIETDGAPGKPATTIATMSVPVARDAKGVPVQVTPVIDGDYVYQQQNLRLDMGPADIFAFPITLTLSYRASSVPATGALSSDWDGLPEGGGPPAVIKAANIIPAPSDYVSDPGGQYRPASIDPTLYGQRHANTCLSGPNEYRSEDGRTANFLSSCQRQAMCLDVSPAQHSANTCKNQAFANMSAQCTATFGQTGDQYDACMGVANGHAAWSKENLLTDPLCQPVAPGADRSRLPSNNNQYC